MPGRGGREERIFVDEGRSESMPWPCEAECDLVWKLALNGRVHRLG